MTKCKEALPDWAVQVSRVRRRLGLNRENLHIFLPAVQMGYETVGCGTIIVGIMTRPTGQNEVVVQVVQQEGPHLKGDLPTFLSILDSVFRTVVKAKRRKFVNKLLG